MFPAGCVYHDCLSVSVFPNFSLMPTPTQVCDSLEPLKFKDLDGNDCNAQLDLSIVQGDATIASSLDLNTPGDGSLFWHTRLATGYTFLEDN